MGRRLLAAQDAGRLVGGGPLCLGEEVSAVVCGMVGIPLQPCLQAAEARELRVRDGCQRGIVPARDQHEHEVVKAERYIARHDGPGRVSASCHQTTDCRLHGAGALIADEAARPLTGRGQLRTPTPTMSARGRSQCPSATLDHGAEQDGRAQDPGGAAIGREQRSDVSPAKRVVALQAGPKAKVQDALGDRRIEHAPLGTGPDMADRTATSLDGGRQPNVDQISSGQSAGQAFGHCLAARTDRTAMIAR